MKPPGPFLWISIIFGKKRKMFKTLRMHTYDSTFERARSHEFGMVIGYIQFHILRRFLTIRTQNVFKKTIIDQKHDFHGQFL
jgi:sugar phosphate permease